MTARRGPSTGAPITAAPSLWPALAALNRARRAHASDFPRLMAEGADALLARPPLALGGPSALRELEQCRRRLAELLTSGAPDAELQECASRLEHAVDDVLGHPSLRLAVYGSLRPGEVNAHVLAPLGGEWIDGRVRGTLRREGWGAGLGFPAIELEADGATVDVKVLQSPALPAHWPRLDEFEGAEYWRSLVAVEGGALRVANIYELKR